MINYNHYKVTSNYRNAVADPGGVLGVPWNPPFLAIIYIVYVVKLAMFLFSRYFASALHSRIKHRENIRVYAIMVTIVRVLMYSWNPPFQNPGSATGMAPVKIKVLVALSFFFEFFSTMLNDKISNYTLPSDR